MEVKEILTYFINQTTGVLDVTFKTTKDEDDEMRIDQIDLEEVEKFGYDFSKPKDDAIFSDDEEFDLFSELDDEPEVDNEELISFLNEYYLLYPNRIPSPTIY